MTTIFDIKIKCQEIKFKNKLIQKKIQDKKHHN
jgi:hypothetical protein